MDGRSSIGVRRILADATDRAHQALHTHEWISRLAADDLRLEDYAYLLGAYLVFFERIEHARREANFYAELTVEPAIAALRADLAELDETPRRSNPSILSKATTRAELLGKLYVLHGSGFGGRFLSTKVHQSLPHAPRQYLGTGTDCDVWRQLVRELETFSADPAGLAILVQSADQTFRSFGRFVTSYCEGFQNNPAIVFRTRVQDPVQA